MAKILVIEDDRSFADDFLYFLNKNGHKCDYASNSNDALEYIKNINKYDLVTMDLMMYRGNSLKDEEPNLSTGVILFKIIRKKNRSIPIIVITAKSRDEVNNVLKDDANTNIVTKPITDLNELVKSWVR